MEVDHCFFPDDLLYDLENNTWLKVEEGNLVTVGVTSILVGIAGKLVRATMKQKGASLDRGQSLGTLESEKFVGPVRSPVSGELVESNPLLADRPKIVNDSCYEDGWIAKLRPIHFSIEKLLLSKAGESRVQLAQIVAKHKVRCFRAFPDREMFEIGTECSAVIVRLNDQMGSMPLGEIVHLVSDDPTSYVEMVAWTERTGQNLLDWRQEDKLFHFIIKKVR